MIDRDRELCTKGSHTVAGVEFLPLRDGDGNVPAALETAVAPLERIPYGAKSGRG